MGAESLHEFRERRLLEARIALFERVYAQLASRLQRVCPDMHPDDFHVLVQRAAEIQIKYEVRRAVPAEP
jgi:hypothetical protein